MTRIVLGFLLLALFIQCSRPQDAPSNPVATLLSNLRSLVENPGPPFEDVLFPAGGLQKEPMYGRPRQDYFKRIRENYGKLQRQVGSALDEMLPKNLFGGSSSSVDVKLPFFPVNVKVKTSATPKEIPGFFEVFDGGKRDVGAKGSVDVSIPSLDVRVRSKGVVGGDDEKASSGVTTDVQVGEMKVRVDSDSKVVVDPLQVVQKRFGGGQAPPTRSWIGLGVKKVGTTGRGKRDATEFASDEQKRSFSAAYYELLSDPEAPAADVDLIDPDLGRGRILGEVLYSEEAFDNMTKEAIKNAKWALDSDLDPAKIIDKLDSVAKLILQRRPRRSKAKRAPEPTTPPAAVEEPLREATVMLALTEAGVPLQVRIGPEVDNPFRFLHKVLSASEVTLRVQTDGSSSDPPAPLLSVDLSDPKQRNSFLDTLRKFRSNRNN